LIEENQLLFFYSKNYFYTFLAKKVFLS